MISAIAVVEVGSNSTSSIGCSGRSSSGSTTAVNTNSLVPQNNDQLTEVSIQQKALEQQCY